jgi:hypothetical protein
VTGLQRHYREGYERAPCELGVSGRGKHHLFPSIDDSTREFASAHAHKGSYGVYVPMLDRVSELKKLCRLYATYIVY